MPRYTSMTRAAKTALLLMAVADACNPAHDFANLVLSKEECYVEHIDEGGIHVRWDKGTSQKPRKRKMKLVPEIIIEIDLILRDLTGMNGNKPCGPEKHVLFCAPPQSGKSMKQLYCLWHAVFVEGKTGVHLLDNRTDSQVQFATRDVPRFRDMVKDVCMRLNVDNWEDYMFSYLSTGRHTRRIHANDISDYNMVISCLGNINQVNKTFTKWNLESGSVCVVQDECDIHIKDPKGKSNQVKFVKSFMKLMSIVSHRMAFTATPIANYNECGIRYDKIVHLPVPANYRGYDHENVRYNYVDERLFKKGGIKYIMDAALNKKPNMTCLVNCEYTIAKMEKMRVKMEENYPNMKVVCYHSKNGSKLSDVMNNRHLHDGPFTIIACQKAGRAVSFRSMPGNSHHSFIDTFVYHPTKTSNEANIVQAMRICGCYDDNIPDFDVFCTRKTHDTIKAAFSNVMATNIHMSRTIDDPRDSRIKFEEIVALYRTGRPMFTHDDTFSDKGNIINSAEFMSKDDILPLLKSLGIDREVVDVTESIGFADIGFSCNFKNLENARGNSEVSRDRSSITRKVKEHLGLPTKSKIHFSWGKDRYEQLVSFRGRSTHPNYNECKVVVGNPFLTGSHNKIPYVVYKDGYTNVRRDMQDDTKMYIFQTTRGNWKVYLPGLAESHGQFRNIRHAD